MDAQTAKSLATWPPIDSPAAMKLVRTLAVSALGLLAAGAILIGVRRAGGALIEPLSPEVLLGCGALLALAALGFRRVFLASPGLSRRTVYALWLAPSAVLLLWAASLSLDGSAVSGLLGLWCPVLVEEAWSWGRLWKQHSTIARPRDTAAPVPRGQSVQTPADLALSDEADGAGDPAVSQQIVRRRQSDAAEVVEGWVRARFVAGQRHATAHVAICPPLDRLPECFAEQMDGPPAQIKVAQVLPYGVRFEIKLDKPPSEASSVAIEFSIQSPSALDS